jgi:membrane protein YqaA with SNARE-associated domain
MKNKTLSFRENRIFAYDRFNKMGFGIGVIFFAILFVLLIITYFFKKESDFVVFKILSTAIAHVFSHINSVSPLGMVYTTLLGGIFFITIPLEVFFVKFLKAGAPIHSIFIFYFLGLIAAFTINYYIGLKLSGLSRRIISPKKFYKIKGILNRHGSWGIFAINALPLPSQILSVILGVFRYNKTRFYIFFPLGQLVKYLVITVFIIFL